MNGALEAVGRAADAIKGASVRAPEPAALRDMRLALLSLPREAANVPEVPKVRLASLRLLSCSSHCLMLYGSDTAELQQSLLDAVRYKYSHKLWQSSSRMWCVELPSNDRCSLTISTQYHGLHLLIISREFCARSLEMRNSFLCSGKSSRTACSISS